MTAKKAIVVEFTIDHSGHGRSLSDDGWETIDTAHIRHWEAACTLLATRNFEYGGLKATLELDWAPLLRRYRHHYRVMTKLASAAGTAAASKIVEGFRNSRVALTGKLRILRGGRGVYHEAVCASLVECFVYDVFLIMNIAAPGSCTFYKSAIHTGARFPAAQLLLSEFYFDDAFLTSRSGKWPALNMIPLEDVCCWYWAIRTGVSQLPHSRVEKALFGLWHISVTDLSATTLVWLCYSLESLFDTKAGANFRYLLGSGPIKYLAARARQ